MYIIIEFYIAYSFMLLLFNLFFILTKNIILSRLNPLKNKSKDLLAVEFERYQPGNGLSPKLIGFLENQIKSTRNLLILEKEMEKRRIYQAEIKEDIKPYIFKKLKHYSHKSKTKKAYYAYFLTLFHYEEGEANAKDYEQILKFLESKSFYVFSNTMDAIYAFKDPYLLLAALRKVDERVGFYHVNLLTDGLLTFDCCPDRMKELILKEFPTFHPEIQVSLINFFRLKGLDISDFALSILEDKEINKEVVYAAMRYFAKFPRKEAKEFYIQILEDQKSFWIDQLLAIQGLERFDESRIRRLIGEEVMSQNWEVRTSAVHYLYQHGLKKDELKQILAFDDRYTTEQLYYYFEKDEELAPIIQEKLIEIKERLTNQSIEEERKDEDNAEFLA